MRRPRRKRAPLSPDINLTSLMDITFVLLISFMIVAPAVRYDIDLTLPQVKESDRLENKKPITLQIALDKESSAAKYYINGAESVLDKVADKIKEQPTWKDSPGVSLEGDRAVPWEEMVRLINELQRHGITDLIIVSEKASK